METLEDKYPELKKLVELTRAKAPEEEIKAEFGECIRKLGSRNPILRLYLDKYIDLSTEGRFK